MKSLRRFLLGSVVQPLDIPSQLFPGIGVNVVGDRNAPGGFMPGALRRFPFCCGRGHGVGSVSGWHVSHTSPSGQSSNPRPITWRSSSRQALQSNASPLWVVWLLKLASTWHPEVLNTLPDGAHTDSHGVSGSKSTSSPARSASIMNCFFDISAPTLLRCESIIAHMTCHVNSY